MYEDSDAEDLAEKWGCTHTNPCWPKHVEIAQDAIDRMKKWMKGRDDVADVLDGADGASSTSTASI